MSLKSSTFLCMSTFVTYNTGEFKDNEIIHAPHLVINWHCKQLHIYFNMYYVYQEETKQEINLLSLNPLRYMKLLNMP